MKLSVGERRRERWRRLLEKAREWARELARELREKSVVVEEILLFGSVARGNFAEDSDMDLVVVSRSWEKYSLEERLAILYRLWRWERDATLIPPTSEELEEKKEKSIVLRDASMYWLGSYRCT